MEIKELLDFVVDKAKDIKAFNIKIYDLRTLSSYADYSIILSVNSNRQAKALAENLKFSLKQDKKLQPLGIEDGGNAWILMDYDNVIIHIFEENQRIYYDLERLWKDLPHENY